MCDEKWQPIEEVEKTKKWRGDEEGGERHYLRCYKPPRGEELRRLYSTVYTGHDRYLYLPTSFLPLKRIISSSFLFFSLFGKSRPRPPPTAHRHIPFQKRESLPVIKRAFLEGEGDLFFLFKSKNVSRPCTHLWNIWENSGKRRGTIVTGFFFFNPIAGQVRDLWHCEMKTATGILLSKTCAEICLFQFDRAGGARLVVAIIAGMRQG